MKKIAFVLVMVMFLTLATLFAESASKITNYHERNVDVQMEILENGDVKLTWDEVFEAVTYKIYNGNTPDTDSFEFLVELDSSHLSHQLSPDSEREFYHMTYTFNTSGETVTDIDGNVYQTVQIGNQIWMAENLKVTHYRNGDPISHLTDNNDWRTASSGAYCAYNNDPDKAEIYGFLYNWYAVEDSRGLAPEGWRIPTDNDIKQLEIFLGMSESQANSTGWRGTNEGSKLAGDSDLWFSGELEDNSNFGSSGFNFLPSGERSSSNGSFVYLRSYGRFWASTQYSDTQAWTRQFLNTHADLSRYNRIKRNGFSVRCVKDVE